MGEVIEDKRRRERSRFRLAENARVIREFQDKYRAFGAQIYGVISLISASVAAKES
jgi:hypothetical protein